MTLTSFLWPIDPNYIVDPNLSAQENEVRQQDHAWIVNTLFVVSTVGMGFLTLGALITAVLLTKIIVFDECIQSSGQEKRPNVSDQFYQPQLKHNDTKLNQHTSLCMCSTSVSEWNGQDKSSQSHHGESQQNKINLMEIDHFGIRRNSSELKTYGSVNN